MTSNKAKLCSKGKGESDKNFQMKILRYYAILICLIMWPLIIQNWIKQEHITVADREVILYTSIMCMNNDKVSGEFFILIMVIL